LNGAAPAAIQRGRRKGENTKEEREGCFRDWFLLWILGAGTREKGGKAERSKGKAQRLERKLGSWCWGLKTRGRRSEPQRSEEDRENGF
jgi:hypothetical protein